MVQFNLIFTRDKYDGPKNRNEQPKPNEPKSGGRNSTIGGWISILKTQKEK